MRPHGIGPAVLAAVVLSTLILGCGSGTQFGPPTTLPSVDGNWGGDGVRLTIDPDGWDLLFNCAEAGIEGAVHSDPNSRFEANGWYFSTAGPVPAGGYPREAVRYQGQVTGSTMSLLVVRVPSGEQIGAFTLHADDPGRVQVCK